MGTGRSPRLGRDRALLHVLLLALLLTACEPADMAPPVPPQDDLPAAVDWDAVDLPTVRYHGRLMDEDGAPLAGARVWILPNGRVLQAAGLPAALYCGEVGFGADPPRWEAIPSSLLPTTTTDSDGRYALDVPWADPLVEVHHQSFCWGHPQAGLVAAAPGRITLGVRLDDPTGGAVDGGERRLHAGATVEGRVVDEQGRPVAGARVVLDEVSEAHGPPGTLVWFESAVRLADLHGAVTDADGRYRLTGQWPGLLTLAASAPGLGRETVEVDTRATDGGPVRAATLRLTPGVSLTGVLRDEAGAPVGDALVFAVPSARVLTDLGRGCIPAPLGPGQDVLPGEMTIREHPWVRRTRSAADGSFDLGGLTDEPHRLYVGHPDHEPLAEDLIPGQAPAQALTLRSAARWELELIDRRDGTPVEDAWLVARRLSGADESDPPLPVRPGDGPGRFVVSGCGPLGTRLTLVADGLPAREVRLDGLSPGDVVQQRLELEAPGTLRGRVLDETGRPIAGLPVTAVCPTCPARHKVKPLPPFVWHATTGPDGRFLFTTLPEGDYRVSVRDVVGVPEQELTLGPGGSAELAFVAGDLGRIVVQLLDPDRQGYPIRERAVRFRPVTRRDGRPVLEAQAPVTSLVVTGDDGRAAAVLASGAWAIDVGGEHAPMVTIGRAEVRELLVGGDGTLLRRDDAGRLVLADQD